MLLSSLFTLRLDLVSGQWWLIVMQLAHTLLRDPGLLLSSPLSPLVYSEGATGWFCPNL